jgi:hypothetical protein
VYVSCQLDCGYHTSVRNASIGILSPAEQAWSPTRRQPGPILLGAQKGACPPFIGQ